MTLHWGENRAIFEGNVRTHIEREPDAAAARQPEIETVTGSGEATAGFTSNSNGAR
jgi:hypothetical protein